MKQLRITLSRPGGDRGSTLPLMLAFFMIAGLLLTGGVTASAAFLAQRDLQSACDGAAVAGASGFVRTTTGRAADLAFDETLARNVIAQYAVDAWGRDASAVDIGIAVDRTRVVVTCARVVHVPFEAIFAPGGVARSVTSSADAPLLG